MANVLQLKARRKAFRGHVTRTIESSAVDQADPLQVIAKLDHYAGLIQDLDDQIIVSLTDESAIEAEVSECCEIMDKILTTKTSLANGYASNIQQTETGTSQQVDNRKLQVKLPKLEIRKFSGEPLEWISFWDSFTSAVHENSSLQASDKFNYLRGMLQGSALAVIAGLPMTNDNYAVAIGLLKKRYDNRSALINAHMKGLVGMSACQDVASLRSTFDQIEKHVRGLQAPGVTEDAYGLMVAPIVLEKLPSDVQLMLSRLHGDNICDLEKLREFIKTEIRARERINFAQFQTGKPKQSSPQKSFSSRKVEGSSPPIPNFSTPLVSTGKAYVCAFCGEPHRCIDCKLSSKAKWDRAFEKRLCYICLRDNHKAAECRSPKKCSRCQRGHHSSLCRSDSGESKSGGLRDQARNLVVYRVPRVPLRLNRAPNPRP